MAKPLTRNTLSRTRNELARRKLCDFIRAAWTQIEPQPYVHGWHIDAICDHLEAVSRGDIKRLLINLPPRHMKSLAVSVMWPAWAWGPYDKPDKRFVFASHALSLSMRDSVRCRRIIENRWYRKAWGARFALTGDQNTKTLFENDKGGHRLATSVDGALTGEGGDIIVVDDPHNVREAESETVRESTLTWWDEAMSTRLNDPATGAYVVIMQRMHEKDLTGHILSRGNDWHHLCLPARYEPHHAHVWTGDRRREHGELLWPERFDEPAVAELERTMGSYAVAGQLQQRPAPRDGAMFQRKWFNIVDTIPNLAGRIRCWDLAATAAVGAGDPDWTVGARVALLADVYYIEDIRRLRGTPGEVEQLIAQTANLDGPAVPVWMEQEPGSAGKTVIDHYRRRVLVGFALHAARATGPKIVRAEPFSAAAEAGNVKLVRGNWNEEFLNEIERFPRGAHDDQVDAVASAAAQLARRHQPRIRVL